MSAGIETRMNIYFETEWGGRELQGNIIGIKHLVRSFKWITIFSPQNSPNTDIFPEYVKENEEK